MMSELSDNGPQIVKPENVLLSEEESVLKVMFASYQRVTVKGELPGGLSGSKVLRVRPVKGDGVPSGELDLRRLAIPALLMPCPTRFWR